MAYVYKLMECKVTSVLIVVRAGVICSGMYGPVRSSLNNAQKEGDRRKRASDGAQTWDLHSFAELQPRAIKWSQSQILHLPSPYVLVVCVSLYIDHLRPTPQGWYSV